MNARKACEGAPRSLDSAYVLSNIELSNFIPFPASDRNTIDLMVRGHHSHRVPFTNRQLKWSQHNHAQFAFPIMHGRCIRATLRRTVPDKVLRLGDYCVVCIQAVPLGVA